MTPDEFDAIERRCAAATEPPWDADSIYFEQLPPADAEFIVHAREDVPALLAWVRGLEKAVIHAAWRKIHIRRFDGPDDGPGPDIAYDGRAKPGGPDSIYNGVLIAEGELREMWHATGDLREIGSIGSDQVDGELDVSRQAGMTDRALVERLATRLRSAVEQAVGDDARATRIIDQVREALASGGD